MCVPGCRETVLRRLSRRGFVGGVGLAAAVAASPPARAAPARAAAPAEPRRLVAALSCFVRPCPHCRRPVPYPLRL